MTWPHLKKKGKPPRKTTEGVATKPPRNHRGGALNEGAMLTSLVCRKKKTRRRSVRKPQKGKNPEKWNRRGLLTSAKTRGYQACLLHAVKREGGIADFTDGPKERETTQQQGKTETKGKPKISTKPPTRSGVKNKKRVVTKTESLLDE